MFYSLFCERRRVLITTSRSYLLMSVIDEGGYSGMKKASKRLQWLSSNSASALAASQPDAVLAY